MMKIILTFLVFCLMGSSLSLAQSADEKAVSAAVEKLRKAMVDSDLAGLRSLAAEELSYGHSNGLVENKTEFVDQFATGKSDFVNITLSDQTVKIVGDAAIVRHRLIADTNNNKVAGKVDILILLVWQKQKGEWKLLARQAARIPPKQ